MTDAEEFDWDAHAAQCEAARTKDINKYRVVGVDNYARENVSDHLHSSYDDAAQAEQAAKELNDHSGPDPNRWYRVYEPGKKIFVFEP